MCNGQILSVFKDTAMYGITRVRVPCIAQAIVLKPNNKQMKKLTILLALGGLAYTGLIVYLMSILDSLNPFEWVVLMCTMFLSLGAVAYGCSELDNKLNNK